MISLPIPVYRIQKLEIKSNSDLISNNAPVLQKTLENVRLYSVY